jgi:chemotaxis protein methyltransferase CheR
LTTQARARGQLWLRIWSAGCASGEEPYSLTLLFAFSEVIEDTRAQIRATDADFTLLERARRGCYPGTSLRDLPEAWRAAFAQSGDRHCLRPQYRRSVRFLEQDIRRSYPEGRFDLILCRNLAFTYFEPALRMAIGTCLTALLAPGGFLVLGVHESLPQPTEGLAAERAWLYRRVTE